MGCNENLAKFSGLNHSRDIFGKTDFDFEWGQDQAAQFVRDDQYVVKTGEMLVTEHVLPQKREDGKRLYIKTKKVPSKEKVANVAN